MSIGTPATPSQFGQILQDQMGQTARMQPNEPVKSRDDESKERQSEPRDTGRAKEGQEREGALQDRVRESRGRDESRDQSDTKQDAKGGEKRDAGQHAKEADQRVVAKQGRGDSSGEQGSQKGSGQEGGEGASQRGKGKQAGLASKGPMPQQARPEVQAAWGQAMSAQTARTSPPTAPSAAPHETIPTRLMEQIVSYARLHSKKDGETELELALHEEIFKGLRLRISTKNGKIKATFITSSRDVRELFQNQKNTLNQQLTENGLEVEGIDVIMT